MKPVAIFRHWVSEGPGYLASTLDRRNIPWCLVRLDAGEPVPAAVDAYSGLVFMGGPMSVNDDLPWIPPVLARIREAVAGGVPVLGHCLGGQLMAKALGGVVTRNPVKEIGWAPVQCSADPLAGAWFGPEAAFTVFHWHGETFSLPPGAVHLLSSAHCANQAFALGPHLGLQCHVEMTEALVRTWCHSGAREIARSAGPAVQSPEAILAGLEERLAALHAVTDRIYDRWLQAVVPGA